MKICIDVRNTKTEIHSAPPELLKFIKAMTSYTDPSFDGIQNNKFNQIDPENAWDGVHRFLHTPKTKPAWLPSGLRDIVFECCERMGFEYDVRDLRTPPEVDVLRYMTPIPLRDYQKEASDALVNSPDGVIVMPPRGGKTRVGLESFRRINQPTLWVAPTSSIVDQTVLRAREFFSEFDVQNIGTNPTPEQYRAFLCVTTAAAAKDLPQEFMDTRHCLFMDEVHHILANNRWGSSMLKKTEHIYHRYGLSGTFFRSNGDDLAMHAFLSRTLYEITTAELMSRGYLVPTYFAFIRVDGPKAKRSGGTHGFHGKGGIGYNGIHTHAARNAIVVDCVRRLHNMGKNVLVIVGAKVQGYALQKMLRELIPKPPQGTEFDAVEFVSTDVKGKVRGILDSFTEGQEVKVLIGTSLVGEGVDLPNADALVYARGEKAAVSLTQGWFRVCTAAEGKQFGIIVDFADTHNKTLQTHARQRWELAAKEPLFRMSYLDSPEEFERWVVGG